MAIIETDSISIAQRDTVDGTAGEWRRINLSSLGRFTQEDTPGEARNISRNRQAQKSKTISSVSGVSYGARLTYDSLDAVSDALFLAATRNRSATLIPVSAVTGSAYTVAAQGTGSDRNALLAANSLIWARGFDTAANNGLKVIGSATSGTSVNVSGLTAETGQSGRISFAGYRIPGGTNKTWTYDQTSALATLTVANANNIPGLNEGQFIYIGSKATADGAIQNAFAGTSGAVISGRARVRSIRSGSIVFDMLQAGLRASDSTSPTGAVDIVFGTFTTNVPFGDANSYNPVREYELHLPELGASNADAYRYSNGNRVNTVGLNIATGGYAELSVESLGTSTDAETTTRRTGADNAVDPVLTDNFETRQDIARVTFEGDTTGGIDINVLSMNWSLSNNMSGTDFVAVPGVGRIGIGTFTTQITSELSLEDINLSGVISGNETINITSVFQNTDGVIIAHIPSMTLARTGETYNPGEIVRVNGTANAFEDERFKTSCSFSTMPVPFGRTELA